VIESEDGGSIGVRSEIIEEEEGVRVSSNERRSNGGNDDFRVSKGDGEGLILSADHGEHRLGEISNILSDDAGGATGDGGAVIEGREIDVSKDGGGVVADVAVEGLREQDVSVGSIHNNSSVCVVHVGEAESQRLSEDVGSISKSHRRKAEASSSVDVGRN